MQRWRMAEGLGEAYSTKGKRGGHKGHRSHTGKFVLPLAAVASHCEPSTHLLFLLSVY